MRTRCAWVPKDDQAYIDYHDHEWGVPVHDDRTHFEFLVLEGAQAGLSWSTILKRRHAYKEAFAHYDYQHVANYSTADVERLVEDSGIIRNRRKIESTINNARHFLAIIDEIGSFDKYIWQFVNHQPKVNAWTSIQKVPAVSRESKQLSQDLYRRGFRFVGPTIMYAHMQACGLVNDHTIDCFRYQDIINLYSVKPHHS